MSGSDRPTWRYNEAGVGTGKGQEGNAETMEHAIAFAETGHLCLGTLHANSANQTIDRIINFFPEERRIRHRAVYGSP